MKLLVLLILLSLNALAHEVTNQYQYYWLKGPQEKSWSHELMAKININESHQLALDTQHLERFNETDNLVRVGWLYRAQKSYWYFSQGLGTDNHFLPTNESSVTHGRGLLNGFSSWITLKAAQYKTNDLWLTQLGLEKEWQPGWFLVASLAGGQSTFGQPANTQAVWGTQWRLGKYVEKNWKSWIFISQAEEAQAQLGRAQTSALKMQGYGGGLEKYFTTNIKSFVQIERNYYPKAQTRFESILLSLTWMKD